MVTFTAVLERHGKTATGFRVPDHVVDALGSTKRPAVRVDLNGHSYRSSIARMGGVFLLGVSAENRTASGVEAGDAVEVTVTLDTEERSVQVPQDLATALKAAPEARAFFEGLSYSRQRWVVESVTSAKRPETRARRVTQIVTRLSEEGGAGR